MKKETLLGMEVYYEDKPVTAPPPGSPAPRGVWVYGPPDQGQYDDVFCLEEDEEDDDPGEIGENELGIDNLVAPFVPDEGDDEWEDHEEEEQGHGGLRDHQRQPARPAGRARRRRR